MIVDPLIIISVIANIATIIGLIISVFTLRKSIKQCEIKIDRILTVKGVNINTNLAEVRIYNEVVKPE